MEDSFNYSEQIDANMSRLSSSMNESFQLNNSQMIRLPKSFRLPNEINNSSKKKTVNTDKKEIEALLEKFDNSSISYDELKKLKKIFYTSKDYDNENEIFNSNSKCSRSDVISDIITIRRKNIKTKKTLLSIIDDLNLNYDSLACLVHNKRKKNNLSDKETNVGHKNTTKENIENNIRNSEKDQIKAKVGGEMKVTKADNTSCLNNSSEQESLISQEHKESLEVINEELRQNSRQVKSNQKKQLFEIKSNKAELIKAIRKKLEDIEIKSKDTSTLLDFNKLPALYKESWSKISEIKFTNIQAHIKNYMDHYFAIVDNGKKLNKTGGEILQLTAIIIAFYYSFEDILGILNDVVKLININNDEEIIKAKMGNKASKWNNRGILSAIKKNNLLAQGKYITDEEWNTKSLGEKIALRFKFNDFNQNPSSTAWNKFSKAEKIKFVENKLRWRMDRIKIFLDNKNMNWPQFGFYLNNFLYYDKRDKRGNYIKIEDEIMELATQKVGSQKMLAFLAQLEKVKNNLNSLSEQCRIGGFVFNKSKKILMHGKSFYKVLKINN